MFISYKYEAKIPFSLKFCRDFFFKNSQKFAKLHMDSQELAKELLRPFDFADRKSWYLSSELFYAFSSKSCDINWISAKILIHIWPQFSLFINRADSMYRASKKEFSTSYSLNKQETSEGSEWFHIYPKVAKTRIIQHLQTFPVFQTNYW